MLGAIAVRVMGETGIEPVSGTSFIVLLMLLGVFLNAQDLLALTPKTPFCLGLVGTTVFGSAISMSGTVIGDYKNSLYIGNRPYHISKGNIMGVVPRRHHRCWRRHLPFHPTGGGTYPTHCSTGQRIRHLLGHFR